MILEKANSRSAWFAHDDNGKLKPLGWEGRAALLAMWAGILVASSLPVPVYMATESTGWTALSMFAPLLPLTIFGVVAHFRLDRRPLETTPTDADNA